MLNYYYVSFTIKTRRIVCVNINFLLAMHRTKQMQAKEEKNAIFSTYGSQIEISLKSHREDKKQKKKILHWLNVIIIKIIIIT